MANEGLSAILQENLLSLLCFDDKHAVIIRGIVPEDSFEGHYREVARTVYVYVDSQKESPKGHLPDLFDTIIERDDRKAKQFREILRHLNRTHSDVNAEFVMKRLYDFVRMQSLKGATMEAIEIFQQGQVSEDALHRIESIFTSAMRRRLEVFDPGVSLGDVDKSLRYLDEPDEEVFYTGVKELDKAKLGPVRKGLHLFIGLRKAGKTWWLVNLAKNAYLEGKRVLHVSLEMSEEKMVRRYHQALFAMCKRRPESDREALWQTRFTLDDLGRLEGLTQSELKPKLSLDDRNIRKKLARRIDGLGVRLDRIRIKSFPTGQLTVAGLVAYLDMLEQQSNFVPDLLIIDMPMLMKLDARYQRLELGRAIIDIRGICAERNIAGAIVGQSNRAGVGKKRVGGENAAEDWSQNATADVVLTYSQTEAERRLGLARIFVDAARDEQDKWTVLISQSYATGQFCRDSVRMTDHYWSVLEGYGNEGGEEASEEDTE